MTKDRGENKAVHLCLDPSRVSARIIRSIDGGPLRRIIKGAGRRPTGTYVAVKAGHRAMPWESRNCELPVLEISEVCSPIVTLLAQPHRLEINATGLRRPLVYFPDLQLTVDPSFISALDAKVPFGLAAISWTPPEIHRKPCTLIVEVKDDNDPRNDDKPYQVKLALARSIYRRLGIRFLTILKSRDIDCVDLQMLREISLEKFANTRPAHVLLAIRLIEASNSGHAKFGDFLDALGEGHRSRSIACALHVRRIISIDLSKGLNSDSLVRLVRGAAKRPRDR